MSIFVNTNVSALNAQRQLFDSSNALQRIRQLAIQSQNGINSASDRNALNSEVSSLKSEISRIATAGFSATGLGLADLSVSTAGGASTALDSIDAALSAIGELRAELGASENVFQSSIRNLSNVNENLSSARSRIRYTDFAAETVNLTKNQILQQASIAVLSQAVNRPQAA